MKLPSMLKILVPGILLFLISINALADGNTPDYFSGNDDSTDYRAMFEKVWRVYDQYYPYFEYKNINWDSVHTAYAPRFKSCQNDAQFARTLLDMLGNLRDFHVGLRLADGTAQSTAFNYPRPVRHNMDWSSLINYVPNIQEKPPLFYGITADNIGYIAIPEWSLETIQVFNSILDQMRDTNGLVIDVRMNVGGNELAAREVASRFASHGVTYAYHQFRNGLRHDAFGSPGARRIAPSTSWRYLKPVAVLMGVVTMSTCESFVMMMERFDNVFTVGEPTRGCSGNPVNVSLPNGIKFSVPRWKALRADRSPFEGQGIEPDYYEAFTESDWINSTDPILVKARDVILAKTGVMQIADNETPIDFELIQNYPNPFNASTTIRYYLKERTHVRMTITNSLGQEILTKVNEIQEPDTYEIRWDARDKHGHSLSSGVYFYKIQAHEFTTVKKMILLR